MGMTNTTGVCDVTQNRGFKAGRRFRVWVAGGALRGVLLHQTSVVQEGLDFATAGPAYLWQMLLLPVLLVLGAFNKRKRQALETRLDELDPASDLFLEWDKRNFCVRPSQVKPLVFLGKAAKKFGNPGYSKWLEVELEGGQKWSFTLATRPESECLEQALRDQGFEVSRS